MRISDIIKALEKERKTHGDIELFYENSDGGSTSLSEIRRVSVKRNYTPWKGHSQTKDVLRLQLGW